MELTVIPFESQPNVRLHDLIDLIHIDQKNHGHPEFNVDDGGIVAGTWSYEVIVISEYIDHKSFFVFVRRTCVL